MLPSFADGTPTKEWTFSAKLGYSENYSHDKVSMQDVNGDGLQDIIIANRGNTSYAYRPMQIDDNGKITFGAPREIVGSKLYRSISQSINSGLITLRGSG